MISIGVITNAGAGKVAAALVGEGGLHELAAGIGIGSGGHNATTGAVLTPSRAVAVTPGEFMRKPCESLTRTGAKFEVEVLLGVSDTAAIGRVVSSMGLYDHGGVLIAVINFSPRPKDAHNTITFAWEIQL